MSWRCGSRHSVLGARRAAVMLAAITMVWSGVAHGAAIKTISAGEFQAELNGLQALTASCSKAALGCDASAVGDDVTVGDPEHGGFAEHWDWLRGALNKAKSAKAEDRAKSMLEASEQLREMRAEVTGVGVAGFDRAKAETREVLARKEFETADGPTWLDRQKAKLSAWLSRLFEGIAQAGMAAPWLGPLMEWLLFTAAAVGLLFFLLRNIARQRLRVALGNAALQSNAWDREAEDWAERAEQYAAAMEWREAVHCLYWAAIVLLESKRAWRHNPTRTPREYVRLLKPGSTQRERLRGLTQIFERVWYGLRDADGEEYALAKALFEQLQRGTSEDEASGVREAMPVGGVA